MPFISLQAVVNPKTAKKLQIIISIFAAVFLTMVVYLGYLQLIRGRDFLEQAKCNRIRIAYIRAPRGLILDRNHKILASNSACYSLYITLEDAKDREAELIKNLWKFFGVGKEEFVSFCKNKTVRPYQPRLLLENISKRQLIIFEENKSSLPGVSLRFEPLRLYQSDAICHVVGYLGEDPSGVYAPGDLVGQDGLERDYDVYLRGKNGREEIEVDAWGRRKKVLASEEPVKGANLITTMDYNLQRLAVALLRNKVGAIVAMDPSNGEILALASSPGFDPNIFVGGVTRHDWERLMRNSDAPLLNRAMQGQYPPGSTVKPFVALGVLNNNINNNNIVSECSGEFPIKDKVFHCWKKDGHGKVDLGHAIQYSCNIYFYKLGLRFGAKNLVDFFKEFDLWKDVWTTNSLLFSGNTAQLAIGQGCISVTPLQLAVAYSALANGGIIYEPHIVSKIPPVQLKRLDFSPEAFNIVKLYLWQAVNCSGGTGARAHIPGIDVAGKTGTAQLTARPMNEEEEKILPRHLRPHSWFAGFAPMQNPRICLVVLVEHGGEGGMSAAPIAKELISYYLKDEPRDFDMEINEKR